MNPLTFRAVLGAVLGAVAISLLIVPQAQASHGSAAPSRATVTTERTQRMTIPAAKFYIGRQLKREYGQVWKHGTNKTWKRCKNVSSIRVTCGLAWVSGRYLYYGKVAAYYRVQQPDLVYTLTGAIRRKHF